MDDTIIKSVKGNVLRLRIPLQIKIKSVKDGKVVETIEDFYPSTEYPVTVRFSHEYGHYDIGCSVDGNVVMVEDKGTLSVKRYAIEVLCRDDDGLPYRFAAPNVVDVVNYTKDADVPSDVEYEVETHTLDGAVFIAYGGGSFEQVQADWTEADIHSKAYIKNKPTNIVEDESYVHTDNNYTDAEKEKLADLENYDDSGIRQELGGKVDKVVGKGLSTNDYTDEEKEKLAGLNNYDDTQVRRLIAETNTNFSNYYTKQDSYSAVEIDTMLRTQRQGRFVVANILPTPSADTMFAIYLVPSETSQSQNIKDEYITLQDGNVYSWEKIGSTAIDLSEYSTTEEMNEAISIALMSYYTKQDVDSKIQSVNNALGQRYTKTEIDSLLDEKQDSIDDLDDIRQGAELGSTALQSFTESDPTVPLWAKQSTKPSYTPQEVGALPANTPLFDGDYNSLANKPDLSGFITISVNNLVNYYLKSETYTKQEVQALIAAIQQFHYEIYASTSDVTSPQGNVLYLIGPTGTGADKYEEYVYDATKQEPWVKIGDTSIDLSGYYTSQQTDSAITQALNAALAGYTTTEALTLLLAGKQDVINDLSEIRSGAAAGATAYQKPQGGIPSSDMSSAVQTSLGKADSSLQPTQQTLTDEQKQQARNNIGAAGVDDVPTLPHNVSYFSEDSGDGIVPTDGIMGEDVVASSAISVNPDVVTAITGEIGSATTITLVVPNDNLRHVWDMFFTTASDGGATIVVPQGATLHVPSGYSIASGKTYEVCIIGVGTKYYLRYGEFA